MEILTAGLRVFRSLPVSIFLYSAVAAGPPDLLVVAGLSGRTGGKLVYTTRAEVRTLNPVFAIDAATREVTERMAADLIHINRSNYRTEPALAKSWKVSPDGLRYELELRSGLRFSDGHPCDAGDVVFTFQVHLDPKVHSGQRDMLTLDGKPIVVRQLDERRVAFELPKPDAVAERMFDGIAILPRHLLEKAWHEGKLAETWGLQTSPSEIAGMGPFRLKESVPGQRIVLERNPYYWKADPAGNHLPYLQEIDFQVGGSEDMQVLRFQSGESDMISRPSAKNFAVLERESARRGYVIKDVGGGFEFNSLFFNLNDDAPSTMAAHQSWFRRRAFRQAVSAAIDRDAVARLVYLGHATPLTGIVPPGNRDWMAPNLPPLVHSVSRARELLTAEGFKWSAAGDLLDPERRKVEFTILASSSNPERMQTAGLLQDDLAKLGMHVQVVGLESRSLVDRVRRTHDYDTFILSYADSDADPNVEMNIWLSSGGSHFWHPEQTTPASPWEAEIDNLMRRQLTERDHAARKRLYDRVQEIVMENLPLIPLVSPDILAGAKKELGNFRPALLDHYTLWNADELYWRSDPAGIRR